MKKIILITLVLSLTTSVVFSQKNKKERCEISYINLPKKIIYDQIKTYSGSVECIGNVNPYVPSKSDIQKLESYETSDINPDMKIVVTIGPLSSIKTEQHSYSETKETNGVKSTIYRYAMRYEANYAFAYNVINTKNNYKLFSYSNGVSNYEKTISTESQSFYSVQELNEHWQRNSTNIINEAVADYVKKELYKCNYNISRNFDFTTKKEFLDFFILKKSDIDDEFNKNIEVIINTVKNIPVNDDINIYRETLAPNIKYLLSLQDKYKKEDKKEDVLFMSVNYDLACLYYSLDMFSEAQTYIDRISDMNIDAKDIKWLSTRIKEEYAKVNQHFVENRHLNYNPVKDFRLTGKIFSSDALNYNEIELKKFKDGAESTDFVDYFNGTTVKGRILFDEDKGEILLYTKENIDNPQLIKSTNVKQFSRNGKMYVSGTINNPKGITRQFFGTRYFSTKIRLVECLDSNLKGNGDFGIQLASKINAPIHQFDNAFSVKKELAEYISDCPIVSEKAKKGVYISAFKFNVENLLILCKDYDNFKE